MHGQLNQLDPLADEVVCDSTFQLEPKSRETAAPSLAQDLPSPLPSLSPPPEGCLDLEDRDGCGVCGVRPRWLQPMADRRVFLVFFALKNVLQATVFTYLVAVQTSVERHFHFSSQQFGILPSVGELGPLLTAVCVSHVASSRHRPRWMVVGVMTIVLGLLCGLGSYLLVPAPVIRDHMTSSRRLCLTSDVAVSSARDEPVECTIDSAGSTRAYLFWAAQYFLIATGTMTIFTISAPYLDDGISQKNSPLYFALGSAARICGPIIGYLLASACVKLYVYPSIDPGISRDDPRWIGAWWLGLVIIAALLSLYAAAVSLFPDRLTPPRHASTSCPAATAACGSDAMVCEQQQQERADVQQVEKTGRQAGHAESCDVAACCQGKDAKHISTDKTFDEETAGRKRSQLNDDATAVAGDSSDVQEQTLHRHHHGDDQLTSTSKQDSRDLAVDNATTSFNDLRRRLARLLRNPVLMASTLATMTYFLGLIGFYSYQPKYIEHMFRVDKATSASYASVSKASLVVGVVVAGVVMRRWQPPARAVTLSIAVLRLCGSAPFVALLFLRCPPLEADLPGVRQSDGLVVETLCSEQCACSTEEYIPVCHRASLDNETPGRSYFSPCHAGCTSTGGANTSDIYTDCRCVGDGGVASVVHAGLCETASACDGVFAAFLAAVSVSGLLQSAVAIPHFIVVLRCVSVADKPVALGLGGAISSLAFGFGPLIAGTLVDSACLVWERSCQVTGACWVYDTQRFRHGVVGFVLCCWLASFVADVVVFVKSGALKLYGEAGGQ